MRMIDRRFAAIEAIWLPDREFGIMPACPVCLSDEHVFGHGWRDTQDHVARRVTNIPIDYNVMSRRSTISQCRCSAVRSMVKTPPQGAARNPHAPCATSPGLSVGAFGGAYVARSLQTTTAGSRRMGSASTCARERQAVTRGQTLTQTLMMDRYYDHEPRANL